MRDRQERERSRYRRGMGSESSRRATQKMADLYSNTCVKLPKGAAFWNAKEAGDEPLIDILLYQVGDGNPFADAGTYHYERTYWVHKGIGPDEKWYVCPKETAKKPCPICEHRDRLKDDPNASKELIEALRPSRRQLFNVIDCNHRDKGVQIWDFAYALFGKLLATYLTKERLAEKLKYWNEFEGGLTLSLGIEKRSFNGNKFIEVKLIEFEERKKDYDAEEMLKKVHCLDELIKVLPYDELQEVFLQTGEGTTNKTKHRFRRSDVKKLHDMTDKELAKFILLNDIDDIDPNDFDDTDKLADAVAEYITERLEGDESDDKKNKGDKKKDKDADKGGDEPEIEEGSTVTWDDDGTERTGTVTAINGKKATVEDDDGTEDKVLLSDLTLAADEGESKDAEIEEGSKVTWTDDDKEDHSGKVIEITGKKAVVKEGTKKYKVTLDDLSLA